MSENRIVLWEFSKKEKFVRTFVFNNFHVYNAKNSLEEANKAIEHWNRIGKYWQYGFWNDAPSWIRNLWTYE